VADLRADEAALTVLHRSGVAVLSEESGATARPWPTGDGAPEHAADGAPGGVAGGADLLVVVDPLDGSTNAGQGIPWFATALCAYDPEGPLAALVVNQARGERYEAVRGQGAWRDGVRIAPSSVTDPGDAMVLLSGYPPHRPRCRQFRALGAAALDLCLVAAGVMDAYIDCSVDAHGVWDYAAAALICQEAGALVVDAHDRELFLRSHGERRTPVAAATPALLGAVLADRRRW
jgi:fructose-1,6-bisphosphatase/inositol monophosphatase family enzyme